MPASGVTVMPAVSQDRDGAMTRSRTARTYQTWVATIAIAVPLPSAAQFDTTGLLALWLCDEGSGGTVADASGNGMHAEIVDRNGVPAWDDGRFGGGIRFDQAGWVDTIEPVVIDTRGFTMGCWVKPGDEQKAFTNIMSSHQEPPQRGVSFEHANLELNTYYVPVGADMGGRHDWLRCGSLTHPSPPHSGPRPFELRADEWQHIVAVRADDGRTLQPYLDGHALPVDTECDSDGSVRAATSRFRLGDWVLGNRAWNGVIDEAFVFNRALTEAEVKSLYEDGWQAALKADTRVGGTHVSPQNNLVTAWAGVKSQVD